MNEASATDDAVDLAGTYNLVQTGSPNALNPGRTTATTGSKDLVGATNLNMFGGNLTFVAWYKTNVQGVIFSNRYGGTDGQGVLLHSANSLAFYCYAPNSPFQLGPFAATADSSSGTWRLMVFRYNLSAKAMSISIDNGAATGNGTHTSTIDTSFVVGGARLALQQDGAGTFIGAYDRRFHGVWQRELSASEEALIYAAGSTFTL